MRMVRAAVAAVLGLAAFAGTAQAETFAVDPVHSTVIFSVSHFNASNVYGRFNEQSGSFDLNDGKPDNVKIEVQAASIDTANQRRDDHLRGPDFFNSREFPTITFASKKVEDGEDGKYKVTGDVTLLGVTKEITVDLKTFPKVESPQGKTLGGLEAHFTIKRSDFGMNFMAGNIGDDISLIVALEGQLK